MYKGAPYMNKIVKKRQQQRILHIHKQNLRAIKPVTQANFNPNVQYNQASNPINNKKRQMLEEDKFTEIQRQNRMLLEKIIAIKNKKPTFKQSVKAHKQSEKLRMNKSLNQGFRRKQLENIQVQNAKLLKRLQDKKSDYQAQKLKQEWKKQKSVIKNLANYPFIIRDRIYSKGRKKSMTSHSFHTREYDPNSLQSPIQLVRIRNINGNNFLVSINFNGQKLQIIGDNKSTRQIKVIQIPRDQALQFIQFQCQNKIQILFDCLRYDINQRILYLVGKGVDIIKPSDIDNEQDTDENKINRQMSNIYQVQLNKQQQSQLMGQGSLNNNQILNNHQENNVEDNEEDNQQDNKQQGEKQVEKQDEVEKQQIKQDNKEQINDQQIVENQPNKIE